MSQYFETDDDKDEFAGKLIVLVGLGLVLMLLAVLALAAEAPTAYAAARWDPLHFKPAIERANDEECLVCHAEVLKPGVRAQSPAGLRADKSLAWYQTLDVYAGEQDSFHRRHMVGELARQRYMNLRCNTCHQGHNPRDEAPGTSATSQSNAYALRKQVNPQTCLMCHGQFNWQVMGLPGSWKEHAETFGNNCLTCHSGIRTSRHNVNFLKPQRHRGRRGARSSDNCYGCHGGRAWYRIQLPVSAPCLGWHGQGGARLGQAASPHPPPSPASCPRPRRRPPPRWRPPSPRPARAPASPPPRPPRAGRSSPTPRCART
jgi:nitrate/TMAO reductase-like tetraheme cytochrome c subunit